MQPNQVIEQAIDGHAAGVALRMGKSTSYVYKMMSEPDSCRYTRFLQLLAAIDAENHLGAAAIVQDLNARFELMQERAPISELRTVDWLAGVSKVVKETSESIQEAIADRDPKRLHKEIAEAIEALRGLQRMTLARAGKCRASEGTSSRVA